MNFLHTPFPGEAEPLLRGAVDGIAWAVVPYPSPVAPGVNGYAQIPAEGHPWSAIETVADIEDQVDCHGGLTWGPVKPFGLLDLMEGLPEELAAEVPPIVEFRHPCRTMAEVGGWIGFDTTHAGDLWSDEALQEAGLEPAEVQIPNLSMGHGLDRHWTLGQVVEETRGLALQVAAARQGRVETVLGDIPAPRGHSR